MTLPLPFHQGCSEKCKPGTGGFGREKRRSVMEFFTVPCPGRGHVFIDGGSLGENNSVDALNVFQCNPGYHNISLTCLVGKNCRAPVQFRKIIATNPIEPMEVPFLCAS
jgi:hypothetical protein